jgi:gliding motility-associated-like protein
MQVNILCLCICIQLIGQNNLIPNHGFEEFEKCPQGLADFEGFVKNWKIANTGTPNYFNACSGGTDTGVPNTFFGYRTAYKGSGFVGIMTSNAFREYISVNLKEPLKANVSYRLSLYTSNIKNPICVSKGLDIVFTDALSLPMNTSGNLVHTPSVSFYPSYEKDIWVYNQACYRAKGGERTIIIGDFHYPNALHDCIGNSGVSYYFIDEVLLIENEEPTQVPLSKKYCDQPFPIVLDALELTGLTTDTARIIWEWDNLVADKKKYIDKNGVYKLRANLPDCVVKDYLLTVYNDDCKTSIYIPNVFTPNDDGKNDTWKIYTEGLSMNRISIFNRIGEVVFSTTDTNSGWDGTNKLQKLPPGVYVYLIDYTNIATNVSYRKSGSITLLR